MRLFVEQPIKDDNTERTSALLVLCEEEATG